MPVAGPPAEPTTEAPAGANLTQRAMGGMVWAAWGSGGIAVLKAVVLVFLTRLLSAADFGLVSAALVVIAFSLNFSQLGIGPALVQRPELERRHVSSAFYSSLVFGLAVAGLVWLLAPALADFFRMPGLVPVVRALALVFPVSGISMVSDNLVQRRLGFRLLANVDVITYAVGYGLVGLGMAFTGWGVWSLVFAQLAQVALRAILLLRACPPVLDPPPSWAALRELMEFGVGQSASRLALMMAMQADNLVVGRWLGAVALGFYSRAFQLMAVPTTLLGDVVDKVLFPMMARMQDDARRLGSGFLQGTALLVLVTLPAGVVAAVLAPDLIAVIFGAKWLGLVPPFQILALGMVFRTGSRMSDSLSRATGRVYRRAWRQVLYAALVFGGAWIGHFDGVTGVAWGVLAAVVLNYIIMAQLSIEVAGLTWGQFLQAQLPGMRLALVVALTTLGGVVLAHQLGLPAIGRLALGCLVAGATVALLVWRAPGFALGEAGMRLREALRPVIAAGLRRVRVGAAA